MVFCQLEAVLRYFIAYTSGAVLDKQDGRSRRALATEPLGEVLRSAFRQEERQGVSGPGSGGAPVQVALLYVRTSSYRLSRRLIV